MKSLFSIILSILCLTSISQLKISNNCLQDIETIVLGIENNEGKISEKLKEQYPINYINNDFYLSILVQVNEDFEENELEDLGVLFGSQISNIVSLKFPVDNLTEIYSIPGIDYLQLAGKIKPHLDRVLTDTRVDSVHAGINLPDSYYGTDVLIGITDWGFDYSSPMFYDTLLQNTRILAAWDQYKNSGPAPNNMTYGTEFSTPEEFIEAGSDTSNVYSYHYHGSHVAGIAGGSGIETDYRGVAIESEYLFASFLVDEASVLDAWQWMYEKSLEEDKRLVVNMSWGLYYMGPNDGTSLLSQALDEYSELGVVFVTSAGNNGNDDFHIQNDFSGDTIKSRINFYSNGSLTALWGQSIHGWGEVGEDFSVNIQVLNSGNQLIEESPWFSSSTFTDYVEDFMVVGINNDTIWYNLSMDSEYPTNDRPQMRFRVKKPFSTYKIVLQATAPSGKVHFWNLTELTNNVGNWGMSFASLGANYLAGDDAYGIGAPACSNSAITVAAYRAEYFTSSGTQIGGNLASFSSEGPLINETLKPEISAPGVSVTSSISSYTDATYTQDAVVSFNDRDYPFAALSGTSMASPVVTGIVALVFDANPYLSSAQVKQIIIDSAREDQDTDDLPDEGDFEWGYGKVTAITAVQLALNITGIEVFLQKLNWTIYPNPANDFIQVDGLENTKSVIEIYDINGKLWLISNSTKTINIQSLPSGNYILKVIQNNKVQQQNFIKE